MTIKWVVTGLVAGVLMGTACDNSKKLTAANQSSTGLKDAYQKALETYQKASELNPANPRLKLILMNTAK